MSEPKGCVTLSRFVASAAAGLVFMPVSGCGGSAGGHAGGNRPPSPCTTPPPAAFITCPAACIEGRAGDVPYAGIDLGKRLPPAAMGGNAGNDV